MEKSSAVSSGVPTVISASSMSTVSSSSADSSTEDTKNSGVFDSRARNAGVKAVLEKRKEDKQKENHRLQKIITGLNEFEFEMQAQCDKNLARLESLKKKSDSSSGSCPSSQSGSRNPSRKNSATSMIRSKENSAQSASGIGLRSRDLTSNSVQQRLNTIENKVNLIMNKLGEMTVNTGNTPTRKVSAAYEATVHGCCEIQYVSNAAIEVLEKAVHTLNELEGLPSVYASIISRNSLRDRYELQNLAAHLTGFVARLKNSKISYDRIVESYDDSCLACSSKACSSSSN